MRRPVILASFILGVFLAGALLSPLIWRVVQSLAGGAEVAFPRVLSRVLMGLTFLGLWPLAKLLRVSRAEFGVSRPCWNQTARGALLALVGMGLFMAVAFACDGRDWRRTLTAGSLAQSAAMAMLSAVVVSPIEEFVFRGVLFGLSRGRRSWVPALVVCSVFFAVVHFLQSPRGAMEVRWTSGFEVLRVMIWPEQGGGALRVVQLVNLALCGGVLAWAYQRSGGLWFSIGLHAGWIFWLKFANALTTVPRDAHAFWGSRKVIDSWGVTALLVVTCALLPLLLPRRMAANSHAREPAKSPAALD